MSVWQLKSLGDICDINIGRTPSRNEPRYWGTGMSWLSIADMNQGRDLKSTKEQITDAAVREVMGSPANPGIVALSFKLSIGKVGIIRTPMFTNEAIATLPIKNHKEIAADYLYWTLRSVNLTAESDDAVMGKTLNKAKLARIQIPVPPLAVQRRIVEVLDQVDGLRAKRRQAISLLDDLARSIFFDMFGDPGVNPKKWPVASLGDVIIDGPQNGIYKPASSYGSGTPIVRIDAFYSGVITKVDALKRLEVSESELKRWMLHPGDVLINRVNSLDYLGKSALVPELKEPTVFESNMMRFSVDSRILNPCFVVQMLQTANIRSQILSRAKNAVNQSSINQRDVRALRILVPPIEIQATYVARLRLIDSLRAAAVWDASKTAELFASLQARAFRGEL